MARWRLRNPHYLNIINPKTGRSTEWEYQETDQFSGETDRQVFKVPKLLDTADPKCMNYPGQIIVCWEGKGDKQDITFFGDPTPEMEPFDQEAEDISASLQSKWSHPIDTLPVNGGMNEKESAFMEMMMKAFAGAVPKAEAVPNTSVSKEEFDALRSQLDEIRAMMATTSPSSPIPARRA